MGVMVALQILPVHLYSVVETLDGSCDNTFSNTSAGVAVFRHATRHPKRHWYNTQILTVYVAIIVPLKFNQIRYYCGIDIIVAFAEELPFATLKFTN